MVERLEHEAEEGGIESGEDLSRASETLAQLARVGDDRIDVSHSPSVILTVGVNGTGKTTTIGKIAWHLQKEIGPIRDHGRRGHLPGGGPGAARRMGGPRRLRDRQRGAGSDPGAVVFDAIEAARARGHDVVIADTAGRLHTQVPLMEELSKVRRVIEKQIEGAPHETLLIVDATTGQNGLRQAKLFQEAVEVSGIVLTKLDGTAKGGIALAIAEELGLPVKLIGIGESLEDLRPFDPDEFAQALLEP